MELAMINWPEMLSQAEDWAAGFWVGTATASLVGIIVAAAALLTHVIRSPAVRDRPELAAVRAESI
jgi:hypothetical protein